MNQATPAIRDLARLLLTFEADQTEPAEGETRAALSAVGFPSEQHCPQRKRKRLPNERTGRGQEP